MFASSITAESNLMQSLIRARFSLMRLVNNTDASSVSYLSLYLNQKA